MQRNRACRFMISGENDTDKGKSSCGNLAKKSKFTNGKAF